MKIDTIIKRDNRGFIVIRVGFPYEFHSHVSTKNGVRLLLKLIERNEMPRSEYLQISCQRLLTESEYSQLKPKKQEYYNVNKGIRR